VPVLPYTLISLKNVHQNQLFPPMRSAAVTIDFAALIVVVFAS